MLLYISITIFGIIIGLAISLFLIRNTRPIKIVKELTEKDKQLIDHQIKSIPIEHLMTSKLLEMDFGNGKSVTINLDSINAILLDRGRIDIQLQNYNLTLYKTNQHELYFIIEYWKRYTFLREELLINTFTKKDNESGQLNKSMD